MARSHPALKRSSSPKKHSSTIYPTSRLTSQSQAQHLHLYLPCHHLHLLLPAQHQAPYPQTSPAQASAHTRRKTQMLSLPLPPSAKPSQQPSSQPLLQVSPSSNRKIHSCQMRPCLRQGAARSLMRIQGTKTRCWSHVYPLCRRKRRSRSC